MSPSQSITFIGVALDAATMRAHSSPQRVDDILRSLPLFRGDWRLPYILFLCLLGKVIAALAVVPLGLLSLRPFSEVDEQPRLVPQAQGGRGATVFAFSLYPCGGREHTCQGVSPLAWFHPVGRWSRQTPALQSSVAEQDCSGKWSAQDLIEQVNLT